MGLWTIAAHESGPLMQTRWRTSPRTAVPPYEVIIPQGGTVDNNNLGPDGLACLRL